MIRLFCDSSFDPRSRQGFAAFVRVEGTAEPSIDDVQLVLFSGTTNTRLELEGVLLALRELADGVAVEVYTDCATVLNLVERRARLQSSDFNNRSGRPLANADLYREFFAHFDRLVLQLHWLKGHKPSREQNAVERIFALVDKAARQKLRSHLRNRC